MYKKFKFLATLLLLAVSVGAWADDVYQKYTGTITEGDYVIYYSGVAMKNEVSSDRLSWSNEAANPENFTNPDASIVWHISASGEYFTIYNAAVQKYAASTGAKNKAQLLDDGTDDKSLWTVSGTSTYEFVNKKNAANNVNKNLRYNSGYGFACYATSTGGALTLYKKVENSSAAATTVTISASGITNTDVYTSTAAGSLSASVTETDGGTAVSGASVTWASSNTNVATIDNNGAVTLVAAGTTTITASYAGNDTYASSSATYELTVTDSTPISYITGYNVDFESNLNLYSDWTFTNAEKATGSISAHGGTYYGTTGGKATASFQTKEVVANPGTFTCYVSKQSTNTTSSTWYIQVSSDGSNWTDVSTQSATSMTKGEWVEFTANLSSYENMYVRLYYNGSTAVRNVDDISLTLRDPNDKVTPTVVIDATALTNDLAGQTNVSAGTATAAVMDSQTAVENVSVTWESSNTGVATIDATTGAVTLIATGTTTLTATFAGNDDYNEASGTYELTVIDSQSPGTQNHPFTVAQAIAAITSGTFDANTNYYVSGIISQVSEVNTTQYYNATYFISDDGQTTTQLEVFRGKFLDNANFTSEDQIQVGDEVTVYGKLIYYQNTTPEIAQGNYLVYHHRKAVRYYLAGSFAADPWFDNKIEMTKGEGNTYTITKEFTVDYTQFKIIKIDEIEGTEAVWYGANADGSYYGVNRNNSTNLPLSASGQNLQIDPAGTYTFTVNVPNEGATTLTVTGWPAPKYYLAGNWGTNESGWTTDKVELTENADGTFSTSMLVGNGTRFKFVKSVDGTETPYGATQTDADYGIHSGHCTGIVLSDNSSASAFVIQMASDRELVFKLNVTDMKFDVTGWPISTEGNMFVKVTSQADFTDGAYLIVNEEAGVAFKGALETLDATSNVINVNIVNNSIVADATTKLSLFTIVNNGKITSASGHYIGMNSYGNGLLQDNNATIYNNTVEIGSDENADIAISTNGGYLHLAYNAGNNQNRFRYYKNVENDVKPIQLYKLVTLPLNDIVITSAEWATYVPTQNVTIPSGVTAYIVTSATSTSVSMSTVTSAPANTGLVVNGGAGTYTPTATSETTDDVTSNLLDVSDGTVVGNGNIYALGNKNSSVGFKKVKSGVTVPAGKPYLTIDNADSSRDFFAFDESEATGIETIESAGFDINAPIYDLQGRQVNRLHKGIFIQNGKKVVVK